MHKNYSAIDQILIDRRKLHPEEDPLTDTQYVVKTAYVVLCGLMIFGPFGLLYVLFEYVIRKALGNPPIYD